MIFKALLLLPAVLQSCLAGNPLVQTTRGRIQGTTVDNRNFTDVMYNEYLGIPYAEQPVRFQKAKLQETRYTREFSAYHHGPACPQPGGVLTFWSENCLYLNIYTPVNATERSSLPVMVFIHGGGFTLWSSISNMFGPDFLVSRNVILVTFNYRLGVTGFLTMGTADAPGNLGLHDSRLALKWVQREITYFGGDKDKVTLVGHGSGSVMTLYHYISPDSVGLFQQAIAQSGSITADWGSYTKDEGITRAKALARAVGCDDTQEDAVILQCLQHTEINKLVENTFTATTYDKCDVPGAAIPFMPVLDDRLWTNSPFFTDSLFNLTQEAKKRGIPLLTGVTSQDGIYFIAEGGESTTATLSSWNWPGEREPWRNSKDCLNYFLPKCMREKLMEPEEGTTLCSASCLGRSGRSKVDKFANKVKKYYFTRRADDTETLKSTVKLYSDNRFNFPFMTVARFFSKNTYAYLFRYDGSWRYPNPYYEKFNVTGVGHGDELPYLFYSFSPNQQQLIYDPESLEMKDFMVDLWTSFARTGKPSHIGWRTVGQGYYLFIDTESSAKPIMDLESEYFNFWAELVRNSSATCPLL